MLQPAPVGSRRTGKRADVDGQPKPESWPCDLAACHAGSRPACPTGTPLLRPALRAWFSDWHCFSTCSRFRVGRRPFAIDASRAGASWSILLQSIRCLCPAHRHQFAGLECFRLLGTPALEPRWGEGWSKRAYGPTVQDATTRSFQEFPIIYLRTKNPFEASASPMLP